MNDPEQPAATAKNEAITKPFVMAIEGKHFAAFVRTQVDPATEFSNVDIWDYKRGQYDLEAGLASLLTVGAFTREEVKAIGVICDAEQNRGKAEREVWKALKNNKLPAPNSEMTIAAPGTDTLKISTGYLIVPHGKASGCIEHACLEAIKLSPDHVACAEAFLQSVLPHIRKAKRPTHANRQAKIKVHSLIAGSGDDPENSLCLSAKVGHMWDFQHPALKIIFDFIRIIQKA